MLNWEAKLLHHCFVDCNVIGIKNAMGTQKYRRKNSGSDLKRPNFTNKAVSAAELITFCLKTINLYLTRVDLKNGKIYTAVTAKDLSIDIIRAS